MHEEPCLVLCPMAFEGKVLNETWQKQGFGPMVKGAKQLPLQSWWWESLNVYVVVSGQGKAQTAASAQMAIQRLRPKAVFCVGSAGALKNNLQVGDCVVATKTVEWDFKSSWDQDALPSFPASESLISLFKRQASHWHYEPIASGDEDIVTPEQVQNLFRLTGASAVAWEGAGAARAAKLSHCPFVEVRAISDVCKALDKNTFKQQLERAMVPLASTMAEVLKDLNS